MPFSHVPQLLLKSLPNSLLSPLDMISRAADTELQVVTSRHLPSVPQDRNLLQDTDEAFFPFRLPHA